MGTRRVAERSARDGPSDVEGVFWALGTTPYIGLADNSECIKVTKH